MLTHTLLEQGPVSLASKALKRAAQILRTGYWHTWEYCCPDFQDENFINHVKVDRYASQFCRGKKVLDVGCGMGYGASHLAESARSVKVIDLSRQAIGFARRRYAHSGIQFRKMKAERLAFARGRFDFVISTENFGHLNDQQGNLSEKGRVLVVDGMLLVATPNREMFLDENNPCHTRELTYGELLDMVRGFFSECVICENSLVPPTAASCGMLEERQRRGVCGVRLQSEPLLWD